MLLIKYTDQPKSCGQILMPKHTSMCLSSSLSKVGYLSSLINGLLRPVVRVRIPRLAAQRDSINSTRTSLKFVVKKHYIFSSPSNRNDQNFLIFSNIMNTLQDSGYFQGFYILVKVKVKYIVMYFKAFSIIFLNNIPVFLSTEFTLSSH